jgi:RNA methyltransferase, TrmH family
MLTSSHNPRLAHIRALIEKRKAREETQAFVLEGVRLVEEALQNGWLPELVLYSAQVSQRGMEAIRAFKDRGVEVIEITSKLMDGLTGTETAPGLLAVMPIQKLTPPSRLDFVLIADNLRDPGNLGTLLRTAAAAGVQAALLSPGTTDPFAPKVLRAGMGAHFYLPIFQTSWEEIRRVCKRAVQPMQVYLAEASEGSASWDLDLRQPLAIIVGSEAEGASQEARALANQNITIPMPGKSESLNAAIAAGILLFEVVRQRRK